MGGWGRLAEATAALAECEARLEEFKKHMERIRVTAKPSKSVDQHDSYRADLKALQVIPLSLTGRASDPPAVLSMAAKRHGCRNKRPMRPSPPRQGCCR